MPVAVEIRAAHRVAETVAAAQRAKEYEEKSW